jgi:hypothetical protein
VLAQNFQLLAEDFGGVAVVPPVGVFCHNPQRYLFAPPPINRGGIGWGVGSQYAL